jgi:hypothetical protein
MGAGHPACAGSDSSCLQAKYGPRLATYASRAPNYTLTDTSHMNTSVYLFLKHFHAAHEPIFCSAASLERCALLE